MEAREALKKAIEAADEDYREHKDESYLSHFYAHKKEKLEDILSRAETGAPIEELLDELKQEHLHLIHLSKEEGLHPTFDWYGEHYWEIVYDGEAAGCEEAIAVLEALPDAGGTI